MNLLAIDTSCENVSLSIMYRGNIVVDFNRRMKFGASKLIFYLDKYFKKECLDSRDIDAFVIGAGPGSFTGLRISFSIVKAFVLALNKPAITIGSFWPCIYDFKDREEKIAVVSDARKNLVYAASFRIVKGVLRIEEREKLTVLKDFLKDKQDYLFLTYNEHLRDYALEFYPKINFYPKNVYPKAKNLLFFGKSCYDNKKFTPIERLEPLYLHPKTCQIRQKGQNP